MVEASHGSTMPEAYGSAPSLPVPTRDPACYGSGGTDPTVTDANLVLGYLNPERIAGGSMSISIDLATKAIDERIAKQFGSTPVEAAAAIFELVTANMAAGVRMVTIERGLDPRDFLLVGFGGSGSIHLAEIARSFGIKHCIVPAQAGVRSAVGLLGTDLSTDQVQSCLMSLDDRDPALIGATFAKLEEQACSELGIDSGKVSEISPTGGHARSRRTISRASASAGRPRAKRSDYQVDHDTLDPGVLHEVQADLRRRPYWCNGARQLSIPVGTESRQIPSRSRRATALGERSTGDATRRADRLVPVLGRHSGEELRLDGPEARGRGRWACPYRRPGLHGGGTTWFHDTNGRSKQPPPENGGCSVSVKLHLRFDVRNPVMAGVDAAERFKSVLEMSEWADRTCGGVVSLSEHHGTPDGYLPDPLTMAAAIAARTTRVGISLNALVAAFYDPLRLAENVALVDILSEGRLALTVVNGYLVSEFEMFGVDMRDRVARTVALVSTLRQAWSGEPFEYQGRTVRVTPGPHRNGGPPISLGGRTPAAARRAAQIADSFSPEIPDVWDVYREEMVRLGKADPGPMMTDRSLAVAYLCPDPETGWSAVGKYLVDEERAFASRHPASNGKPGYEPAADTTELRRRNRHRIVSPDELVMLLKERGPETTVVMQPMLGGTPPALAWQGLRLFEDQVLPAL